MDKKLLEMHPDFIGMVKLNLEVHALLVNWAEGTAPSIIKGAGKRGFEAWRRLHEEYDARTRRSRRASLRKALNPKPAKNSSDIIQKQED